VPSGMRALMRAICGVQADNAASIKPTPSVRSNTAWRPITLDRDILVIVAAADRFIRAL